MGQIVTGGKTVGMEQVVESRGGGFDTVCYTFSPCRHKLRVDMPAAFVPLGQ